MNGSEPPSSSTLFFRACPAVAATDMPARSLPVRVTAAMRGSSMIAATSLLSTNRLVKTPSGKPGPPEEVLEQERRLRDVGRVLEQPDVAHHEGRRGEADHLPQREVPRHDGQHRTERLVVHVRTRRRRWRSARRPAAPRRARRTSAGPWRTWTPRPWRRRRSCPSRWSRSGPCRALALEQVGRVDQVAGPLGEAGGAVLGEGVDGPLPGGPPPRPGVWAAKVFSVWPVAGLTVA